jgi:hypothetical protein
VLGWEDGVCKTWFKRLLSIELRTRTINEKNVLKFYFGPAVFLNSYITRPIFTLFRDNLCNLPCSRSKELMNIATKGQRLWNSNSFNITSNLWRVNVKPSYIIVVSTTFGWKDIAQFVDFLQNFGRIFLEQNGKTAKWRDF